MAQVKEGTENRGSIESVVRVVRKTLLSVKPPLPIPPNSKRRMYNGWAMIDAGNFAVHIMSKQTREKYFENIETRSSEW
jgi:ribosomal silencing factor RsfS